MDTLTDEMKPIWVPATIEDFKVKSPLEEKLMCSCQLFLQDHMLMNDPDSLDKPTKMSIVDICQGHSTLMLPVYYSAPSQGQLVQLAVLTR